MSTVKPVEAIFRKIINDKKLTRISLLSAAAVIGTSYM